VIEFSNACYLFLAKMTTVFNFNKIYYICNILEGEKLTKDKDIWMREDLLNDSLQRFSFLVFSQNQELLDLRVFRHLNN
jgi:hypothetical protein